MTENTHERSSFEWGVLWMLLSASCLSISFLFLKINIGYFDYFFLLFLRFFVPFLFIVFFMTLFWKWKELAHSKHLWLQVARCGCILVSQYSIAFYLTQNTLFNATVLLTSSPLFIPLIEWAFLKHRPGKSTIFGTLIAFIGVILVLHPDKSLFTAMSAIGILAAVGQAGSQVLYGLKSKTESSWKSLFYLFFLTSTAAFFIFILRGTKATFWAESPPKDIPLTLLIISVLTMGAGTLFNQYFRGLAYRCGRPSTLVTFLYFSVFLSALFDWFIFKNSPPTLSILGGCLIILGGVMKVFLRRHILKKNLK